MKGSQKKQNRNWGPKSRGLNPAFTTLGNSRYRQGLRLITPWLLCGLTIFGLLMGPAIDSAQTFAQLPPLVPPSGKGVPTGVEQRGTLESTDISLDGEELFRIASPAIINRSEPGNQIPVEVRARQIEGNLQRLFPTKRSSAPPLDPQTLNVVARTMNGFPVLFVEDATLTQPRAVVTVTDADSQYYALSKEELADQWQDILEQKLRQAIQLRQPEALRQQTITVGRALIGVLGATLVLGTAWAILGRRERYLRQRQEAETTLALAQNASANNSSSVEPKNQLFQGLHHHLGLKRRLDIVCFLRWLLFWSIAFSWAFTIAYSLNTFPQTRQFARKLVVAPIVLLLTWFVIGLVNRLIDLSVEKFIQKLAKDQSFTPSNLQRVTTIAEVIKGVKMVLVYTVGVLWVLQWFRLVPGSVLALGTAVALVISFAAQNLVRDLVNGFLILLEDQYRIGDVVAIGEKSGLVENLNLRVTQLRNPAGNLITLPNSSIVEVENLSRDWARADVSIEVAYDTDPDLALSIVRDTAEQMAQDPAWQSIILNTREFLGIESLSNSGILIRIWLRTAPIKQWEVAMEFRRRLKRAFDYHHIQISMPRQVWIQNGDEKSYSVEPSQVIE